MKRITPFLCALIFTLALFFFPASPPLRAHSQVPAEPGSAVWKISKGSNTLFLGGSIHILRQEDFPLPKEFDLAFAQSAILVLEADIEQMSNPNIVQYLTSQMLLPGGQTLRSILDTETYELIAAALIEYGIPIGVLSNFKPSMVMSMLSILQMQKFGFVQQGVDMYFLEKARRENKPVKFLETVQSQIDALTSMGDGYESDFVRYSMQDMANTEAMLDRLLAEWRRGDGSFSEITLTGMKEQWPKIYKALITDRHDAWMPQIKEFLASGTTYFVIAGLLHMHGQDGLLRLLEDSGYNVVQFK